MLKNFQKELTQLEYEIFQSPFGQMIIAADTKGVLYAAFSDTQEKALLDLKSEFPNAVLVRKELIFQDKVNYIFQGRFEYLSQIPLYILGSDFQRAVWSAVQNIAPGQRATYAQIAQRIGAPKAVRAVGTALGRNRLAFFIGCHRVIPSTGAQFGQYRWGAARKAAILQWEQSLDIPCN